MNHILEALEKLQSVIIESDSPDMKKCSASTCKYYDSEEESHCSLVFINVNAIGKCIKFTPSKENKTKTVESNPVKSQSSKPDKDEPDFEWNESSKSYKRVRK